MIFPWRRRREPIEQGWQEVAARLSLVPSPEKRLLLTELLDLADESEMGPVYRVSETGDLDVWVFSYRGSMDPRTRAQLWVTACLLTSGRPFSPTGWRATRKVHAVIASLQASAAGGQIVDLGGDSGEDGALTVVAREVDTTRRMMTPAVRTVLERAVTRLDPPPNVTVGEQRIHMSVAATEVRFDAVELMLADTMSLYAALSA